MGDACPRCGGKGILPKVPGDWRVTVTCKSCAGTGRRGGNR